MNPSSTYQSNRSKIMGAVLCWLFVVFDGYDLIVFGAVRTELLHESWGLTEATAGTLGSIAFLGMALGALIGGRLADKFGRKRTIITAVIVFSIATFLNGLAGSPEMFGALRLIAGFGLGALVPIANTLTGELVSPRARGAMATLMMSGVPLGGSASSLLGIIVIPTLGWRWMFFIPIVAVLVLVPLAVKYLPETGIKSSYSAPAADHSDTRAFSPRLRALMTVMFIVAAFATLFTWYGLGTELPHLMNLKSYSLGSSLTFALTLNLGAVVGSVATALISLRAGTLWTGFAAAFVGGMGLLLLTFEMPEGWLYVILVLAGIGTHGTQCLLNGAVTRYYPQEIRGTTLGLTLGIGRIGTIVAPQFSGVLLAGGAGPNVVLACFGASALLASVIIIMIIPVAKRLSSQKTELTPARV